MGTGIFTRYVIVSFAVGILFAALSFIRNAPYIDVTDILIISFVMVWAYYKEKQITNGD